MREWCIRLLPVLLVFAPGCDGADPWPDGAVANCDFGDTQCGLECVDVMSDREHCGACDNTCDTGFSCVDGDCDLVCPEGQTACSGTCVDVDRDPSHCGACDATCEAGEVCTDGACEVSCPPGQDICDGQCTLTESDPANCGGCGDACDDGEVCMMGACAVTCGADLMECSGSCVDLAINPIHCGACGNVCPIGFAADGVCVAGECQTYCQDLQGDCNGDLAMMDGDGCETRLEMDVDNCGACRRECVFDNATGSCTAGDCVIATCDAGFDDCDTDGTNGCEAEIAADSTNCGACGTVCASGEACVMGVCTPASADTCSSVVALTAGVNTIMWTAFGAEYLAAYSDYPTGCVPVSSYVPDGPDLVMSYTASSAETVTFALTNRPSSTRWALVGNARPCGTIQSSDACSSEFGSTTMDVDVTLAAGETAYVYVVDTTSGSNPLSNPLEVTVTVTP